MMAMSDCLRAVKIKPGELGYAYAPHSELMSHMRLSATPIIFGLTMGVLGAYVVYVLDDKGTPLFYCLPGEAGVFLSRDDNGEVDAYYCPNMNCPDLSLSRPIPLSPLEIVRED